MNVRQDVAIWSLVKKCEVIRKALVLKAWKHGADFALHRGLDDKGWIVTDLYSQAPVTAIEKTALRALKRSKATLERFGYDAYLKARESRKRERIEDIRERLDKTVHSTPITVDMILDLAKIAVLSTADFK